VVGVTVPTRPGLLTVEEALERILAAVHGPLPAALLAPEAALGRYLAEPARATTDLPPWDNSAMDGYAVRAADVAGASEDRPVALRIVGEVAAGFVPTEPVEAGTAIRIATGAPMPPGADAVVPVELTVPIDAENRPIGGRSRDASGPLPAGCLVFDSVAVGGSVRERGGDLRAGTVILATGSRVTPAAVALAAGAGVGALSVHRAARVGVLATGDELRVPGDPLGPAGIPDANGPGLRALVVSSGAIPIDLGIARDVLDDATARVRRGVETADVVIVSGGVSVGPYDVVRGAFEAIGRVDLWRVAVQPGKPFVFGTAPRPGGDGSVLLFGLPGNPVSTAVTFELFVRPALLRLAGAREVEEPLDRALLLEPVRKSPGRRGFVRVVAERAESGAVRRDGQGRVLVRLAGGQGSHVLSALAAADALAVIPEAVDRLDAGAEVALRWLERR
jgi:molybdopterin molybdotransferase